MDDLHESGLLDSTLIVMAGEFGRTPRISSLPEHYKLPGRDHWGKVQTVFLAGGGVVGGRVVGSSDKIGGFPRSDPQTPENLAATIYHALGLPATVAWHDAQDRPHFVYRGDPIAGLFLDSDLLGGRHRCDRLGNQVVAQPSDRNWSRRRRKCPDKMFRRS